MVQAYSYIRFSSKRQELGDSLTRQTKLRDEYLARHPDLALNPATYEDLGVSAYRGKNAAEGNLKMFLDAIKSRSIKKGSYFLIESLDRLSRAEVMDALELFLSIINSGITIVTLLDSREYSRESIRANWSELIISIAQMARSAEESATKGERVAGAWKRLRQEAATGKIISKNAPAWLSVSETGKWIVDRKAASTIKRLFRLALDGKGCPTIARFMNEAGSTTPSGNPWTFGTVNFTLRNRAVLGEYVSRKSKAESIAGYYPRIVDENIFNLVQDTLRKRRWIGGRGSHSVQNLFAGMSYCAECHSRMRVVQSSGKTPNKKLRVYLRCQLADAHAGCHQKQFPYLKAERAILDHLGRNLAKLITDIEQDTVDPKLLRAAEREDLCRRQERLLQIAETADVPMVGQRLRELQDQIDRLDADEVVPVISRAAMQSAAQMFERLSGDVRDRETRLKLQTALRRVVKAVHFLVDDKRPTVAIEYIDAIRRPVTYIDVTPYDLRKTRKTGAARKPVQEEVTG